MENKILVVIFRESNKSINKRFIDVPAHKSMKDYIDEVWGKLLQASDGADIKQIIVVTFGEVISYSKSDSIQLQAWPTYYPSLNDMKGGTNIVKQIINKMEDWGVDDDGQILPLTDEALDFQLDNSVEQAEQLLTDEDVSEIVNLFKNKFIPVSLDYGDKIFDEIENLVSFKICKNKCISNDELLKNIKDYRASIKNGINNILDKIYDNQQNNVYIPKHLQQSLISFVNCWLTISENWGDFEKYSPSLINLYPFDESFYEYNQKVIDWTKGIIEKSHIKYVNLDAISADKSVNNTEIAYQIIYNFKNSYENILNYFLGEYNDSDNQSDLNTILSENYPFKESFDEIGIEKGLNIVDWFVQTISDIINYTEYDVSQLSEEEQKNLYGFYSNFVILLNNLDVAQLYFDEDTLYFKNIMVLKKLNPKLLNKIKSGINKSGIDYVNSDRLTKIDNYQMSSGLTNVYSYFKNCLINFTKLIDSKNPIIVDFLASFEDVEVLRHWLIDCLNGLEKQK